MVPHKTVKLTGDVGKTANLNPRDGANPATSPRVLVEVTLAKCIVQIACDGVGRRGMVELLGVCHPSEFAARNIRHGQT